MRIRPLRWVRSSAGRDDRGSSLVESAIVLPVFFLLVFAIIEFGLLFKSTLTVDDMARVGARAATASGADLDTDYRILQAIGRSASALNNGSLDMVVVFKASGSADSINSSTFAGCRAGSSVAGVCNVYFPGDLARPASDFGCDLSKPSPDRFWCPTTRKVSQSNVVPRSYPDYVGVWVKAEHHPVTGLMGSQRTLTNQTIMRLEPMVLG